MTIRQLIESYFDFGDFELILMTKENDKLKNIGTFKTDSIGIKSYLDYKIEKWCFNDNNERALVLFVGGVIS